MPRDASGTRARLIAVAEELFATRGVFETTTREIVEAAEQRNVSAVTYHFGSRDGLLETILLQHGNPMDERRGALVGDDLTHLGTRELVAALVIPYGGAVRDHRGRHYVRIVAQLQERFATWRTEVELSGVNLVRILSELQDRTPGSAAIGRERIVGAIVLMTGMVAERARMIEERRTVNDHGEFISNLTDMIVGVLEVPVGDVLPVEPAVAERVP